MKWILERLSHVLLVEQERRGAALGATWESPVTVKLSRLVGF